MLNKLLTLKQISEVFKTLAVRWPDAHCELIYNNGFQLLIAVVLSAQATDKSVNKALAPLFEKNPQFSAADLLEMGEQNFLQAIRSVGLAPTKSKNCLLIAKELTQKYAGQVPSSRADLEALPGVGRKTANVVLNVFFQQPTMAVDTHVERVSKRLGVVEVEASRLEVEEKLLKSVPSELLLNAHHTLIFQGRYICVARSPQCNLCSLEKICLKKI